MHKDYTIKTLNDYSRLDEIYRLTHDSLVKVGDIEPQPDGKVISFPNLDRIEQTRIVIAEKDGEIVGTVSLTVDGPDGLNTDHYFKEETDVIRQTFNGKICSTWRMATAPEYRGSALLVRELIIESFRTAQYNSCGLCLFVFNERHVKIYQRIIKAEVIARRAESVDGKKQLPMAMMQMDMNRGWDKFNQYQKPMASSV
jgi:hypothetical protein